MNSNNERMSTKESTEFISKLFIITKNKSLVEAINILKSVLYILRLETRLPNKFRMECCIEQYLDLGKNKYNWKYVYKFTPRMILKYGNFDETLGNEYIQKVYEYEEETAPALNHKDAIYTVTLEPTSDSVNSAHLFVLFCPVINSLIIFLLYFITLRFILRSR